MTSITSRSSDILINPAILDGLAKGAASGLEPDITQARRFLRLLDAQAETFTFQTFTDRKPTPKPDPLAQVIPSSASDLKDLIASHDNGAGIFVTINLTDGTGRKSENITAVRAVWQEDDDGGEHVFPLAPSMVIETSPGHFHRYWLVEGHWPADAQGRANFAGVMERMIESYGSDKGAKDISRVLRVPGFLHRKTYESRPVSIVEASGRRYTRAEIIAAFPKVERPRGETTTPHKWQPRDDDDQRIEGALRFIDADNRDTWLQIGMALKHHYGDGGRHLWDNWARQSPKFNERDQDSTWRSLQRNGISIATLFHHAKQSGWKPKTNGRADGDYSSSTNTGAGDANDRSRGFENDKPKDWPEPKPLPNGLAPVDPFSMEFLPDKLVPWIDDIANRLQCPPDYVAVAATTALGAVIGRRAGIKPQAKTDWVEVPNLWGMFIGRPGMLKSPAMTEALKPLHHLEALAAQDNTLSEVRHKADVEAYAMRKAVKASLMKEAMKKKGKPTAAIDLGFELGEEPKEPLPIRYCTNDSSYEKLGELLIANPAGILVERDELVSLLKHLDADEQIVARGFYLSGWSGQQPYSFDRIVRGTLRVPAVCISVLGNTQPSRIAEYVRRANADGGGGDGLLQRFSLMVWPDNPGSWDDVDQWPNREAKEAAFAIFSDLSKLTEQEAINRGASKGPFDALPYFRFREGALADFKEWRADLEWRLRAGDLSPALEGHIAKYRKLVPSLALINHLVDGDYGGEVEQMSLLKALAFVKYLESHARRIYGASNTVDVTAAKAILARIRKGDLQDGFTARDVHQRAWSNLTDRDHVKAGLDLLVDSDHLADSVMQTKGRPKTTYTINPNGQK
jgi:putative DNA primase/helicase